MTDGKKYAIICEYVFKERKRRGITPKPESSDEPSCEMAGEFYNFVEVQLMLTLQGYGSWFQLRHPEILEGAYRYVVTGRRF